MHACTTLSLVPRPPTETLVICALFSDCDSPLFQNDNDNAGPHRNISISIPENSSGFTIGIDSKYRIKLRSKSKIHFELRSRFKLIF